MPTDPLEQPVRRRAIVVATAVLATSAFVGSVSGDDPAALPSIALGWHLLLHAERALAVGAVVAVALIFLIRGWEGYFPLKLSASGAEYGMRAAGDAAHNEDDISAGLARIRRDRLMLAASLREDIRTMEQRIGALEERREDQ